MKSFLRLESGVSFHDILEMFVYETVQSWKIVLIVDNLGLGILVCCEFDEI